MATPAAQLSSRKQLYTAPTVPAICGGVTLKTAMLEGAHEPIHIQGTQLINSLRRCEYHRNTRRTKKKTRECEPPVLISRVGKRQQGGPCDRKDHSKHYDVFQPVLLLQNVANDDKRDAHKADREAGEQTVSITQPASDDERLTSEPP